MTLVKAKMAFYHDAVGTRAHNEVFEVRNQEVCSQLEKAGYVQKLEGQEAQVYEQQQQLQKEVGQRNALTNEAVSLAHHEQNQQANQHHQQVTQMRQQQAQQAQQQQGQTQQATGQTAQQTQMQQAQSEQAQQAQTKAQAKKAEK
jgi:hypothetical protein